MSFGDLPSSGKGLFSNFASDKKRGPAKTYCATHDKCIPSSDQVIKTEQTNTLLRQLSRISKIRVAQQEKGVKRSASESNSSTTPTNSSTTVSESTRPSKNPRLS
eukprot:c11109_g1_i1.p1 GENE.c11109_g1_i1~~c11109_g1_i1.p1  ORF type:complete len:105 (+),score=24.06 c11109_g1_i1:17-331(+)